MPGAYKVEGIGEDFIPRNVDLKLIDEVIRVSDKDSFVAARRLAREEGILVGGSAGTATFAAMQYCQNLTEKDVAVILMADGGRGYLSKMFSDEWMRASGFLPSSDQSYFVSDLLERKAKRSKIPVMVVVRPEDSVQRAIELMQEYAIDQLPVITKDGQSVGSINDVVTMQVVYERRDPSATPINTVMGRPFPQYDKNTELDQVYKAFKLGTAMIVVTEEHKAVGVITKFDMMAHLRELTSRKSVDTEDTVGAKR
jgi:cystathionine beta-synthase